MSDLTLTIYAMTAFTFAFLAVALVEEWRMTHIPARRPVLISKRRTRQFAGSRR